MSSEGLMLSGARDLGSSGAEDGFVSTAGGGEAYYSPETQINKTNKYNEMDWARIQNGERKQPDYIVVFRKNGKIPNMKEAQKASKDWGELPIVIVDKDKCLETEKQKVNNMMERYHNGEKHLAGEIWQKIRNNRVTHSDFCEEIDLEQLKEEAEAQKQQEEEQEKNEPEQLQSKDEVLEKERQVGIEDLEENYERTTPQERKQEVSKIRNINNKIQQIVNEKEGEEVGE